MKIKVTKKFKDKYTKVWHRINDELEVTNERYNEIKEFVKIIEKKPIKIKPKKSVSR